MQSARRAWALLTAGLVVAAVWSVSVGALDISWSTSASVLLLEPLGLGGAGARDVERTVLLSLRAPRVVLAALVGAALGSGGAAIQGLFRNPLADPGLVGISAGASLGAALAIVLGGGVLASLPGWARPALLPVASFAGGALATAVVLRLGRGLRGKAATATVLLAGVAVNAMVGALVGLLSQVADDAELRDLVFWTMGGLGRASWTVVAFTAPWILLAVFGLPRLGRTLDLLALGERDATYLGVDVPRMQRLIVAAVAISVGAAVAAAGLIGFVGLVIPHLARILVGARHRSSIALSALAGAALLVAADGVSRTVVAPAELPVGLFTAALGAPFFLYLLRKETAS